MALLQPVLAHQGGWDEMLMVAAPLVLLGLLLFLANRRAGQLDDESEDESSTRG